MPADLVEFLRARLDETAQDADDIHDTNLCDTVPRYGGLTGPCDCGWPARVLAEVAAKRALAGWHAPTGSRDPVTCGLCPHGRAVHPDGGACVDRDCDCQGFDDDRELMYPGAARLCGFCGPGDNWPARDPEDFPHALWPCRQVRLLVLPYASHPDFDPAWSAQTQEATP